jgi:hypothetical protein
VAPLADFRGPLEVILLGFEKDSTHQIHAYDGVSSIVVDIVEGRTHRQGEGPDADGDGVVNAVEKVYDNGPSMKLLDGDLWRGGESNFDRGEAFGIGERDAGAFPSEPGAARGPENGLGFSMTLAHAIKGGQPFPKCPSQGPHAEAAEDFVGQLCSSQGEATVGERDR